VAAAPTVTGFSPGSGGAGTTVTINGTGFDAFTVVKVSGIGWSINSINAQSTISASVPNAAASGPICVTTDLGTGCSTGVFNVTGPLKFVTTTLPNATGGQAYSQPLAASGGTTPYTWALNGGSLPPGLALDSATGILSGTPAAQAGGNTFNFMV